jgi:uncharacterized protein
VGLTRRELLGLGGVAVVGAGLGLTARARSSPTSVSDSYGPLGPFDGDGVRVAEGFQARAVARSGQLVPGTPYEWHGAPDGGACFVHPDGGWVYVSNSEIDGNGGGVSAIRFDASGNVIDAYVLASGTSRNCAGGATSWGTWLSCEEVESGIVYECDPTGQAGASPRPALGAFRHEAAAEHRPSGIVYLTEDQPDGRVYRFIPDSPGNLSAGRLQAAAVTDSTVDWIDVSAAGPERSPATTAFNGGEGIVIDGSSLLVTTKGDDRIWDINLASNTITVLYDGHVTPTALSGIDQIIVHPHTRDLYVAEDGGDMQLVRIAQGASADRSTVTPFLQFVGHDTSEVTGPALSPDGSRLYVSSQRGSDGTNGLTVEVTGPFGGTADVATVSGRHVARRVGLPSSGM